MNTILKSSATGFVDKNGRDILIGDAVKFTDDVQVSTRVVARRGRRRDTYPVTRKMDIIGIVKFGMFKYYFDQMMTFYIDTEASTSYDSYFWTMTNKDAPKKVTKNLSCVLTDKLAKMCEVMDDSKA